MTATTGGTRSHWAWGYEERFPDEDRRRALAEQLGALLAIEARPRPLPRLEDARLPAPAIAIPDELAAFATDDRRARALHTYGRGYPDLVRAFAGDFASAPDLVLTPSSEEEIGRAMAWAERAGVELVPFGGGTSVVGGVERSGSGRLGAAASLDLARMDRVLAIDEASRAARIQAGATGPVLEAQLGAGGLTLRHFPQSFEHSTLGGWIATRAGGHFATGYTHIDDLVESVRMLTPRGAWASRRLPGSGAGPAPDRMVLGSEGILGVITEAWVRVRPRPGWRASASVRFDTFEAGAEAARSIAQDGLFPSNLRLLDAREALLNAVAADGRAVLVIGFESDGAPRHAWMDRALELARARGGDCARGVRERSGADPGGGDDPAAAWRRAFIEAPYLQSALVSLGVMADTFETACTWADLPRLDAAVRARIAAAFAALSVPGSLSCRFTHVYPDGPAPYYTWICGAPPPGDTAALLAAWRAIKDAASSAIADSGATITHHHAVGRVHRPWYLAEAPAPFLVALRAAKDALDPAGILNPGVLLPERA